MPRPRRLVCLNRAVCVWTAPGQSGIVHGMTEPNLNAVARHLAAHGMTWTPDPPPSGTLANINTLVHVDGSPHVLRRPPPGSTSG